MYEEPAGWTWCFMPTQLAIEKKTSIVDLVWCVLIDDDFDILVSIYLKKKIERVRNLVNSFVVVQNEWFCTSQ
jgi:hypothetical protein